MKKILYTLIIVPLLGFAQNENPCYSINDIFIQMDGENPSLEVNLVAGWNMIGYPCSQDMLLTDGFSSVDDKISMVKNNIGAVYIPEFNFNGIGFLESGQGYQVKMNEFVMGFSFCQSVQYPTLEGCADCEAVNFNQWANVDDGSCNYDSDGDGVPDSEEVIGCQDSMACDYDIAATDSGECSYFQEGYDCDDNFIAEIGDEVFGGTLFYYDEIENMGLVASIDNIGDMPWGCVSTSVDGADLTFIGSGYQNSIDIAAECNENPIAASASLNFESNGFSDWFLPSQFELDLMYSENILDNHQYWASTESNESSSTAYVKNPNGTSTYWFKAASCFVHPIRAFGNWTYGCTDETACNYNNYANLADGSCTYTLQGYDCDGNVIAEIGDIIEGGYLFYLDETGQHGLVAAMEDLGQFEWGCYGAELSGADGTSIGTGYQNTLDIVAGCSETPTAASVALSLYSVNFSDWYLPSKDELLLMYNTIGNSYLQANIGGFQDEVYWSSSENDTFTAWFVDFDGGAAFAYFVKSNPFRVRAIRSF